MPKRAYIQRRYLAGRPVFEAGEPVEVLVAGETAWRSGVVAFRHPIQNTYGRRDYQYEVRGATGDAEWVGYFDSSRIRDKGAN
jgi:hypothetical protein